MANTLSDWIKAFSDCEIPVLHQSKRRIRELLQDEQGITVTVLTEIARQDPGFAISLLRRAGKSSKKEITTIAHAISLISIPLVIKMLTDLPELEKIVDKKYLSKIIDIYSYQYHVARMAREWSILRKELENNENYTAALNRSFFSFMLYLIDPDMANQVEKLYFSDPENHVKNEKKLLGYSVDEISESIAKSWKLPELIRQSYNGKHHNPKITGVRLAIELMHHVYSETSVRYPKELITRIAEYIRVPIDSAPGKLNSIIIKTIRDSYKDLPYQHLLLIMMSYPASIKVKPKQSNTEVKKLKYTLFPDTIDLLQSNESNKSTRELIEITMNAMKKGIGFSRVLFIPFDKAENCLNVKFEILDQELPSTKPLRISIELNKLFSQILKKEQTICINPKNQHKFSYLLPEKLRPMKPNATIIINSFYINNKITGCFFVDHGNTDKQLSANDLKLFNIICTELKSAIESGLIKKNAIKKVA
ncbi:MAG: HDOD domain-containing protein [Proteobacteria bacterium]|nr:HDOD domain-containing protein [Pseudomonadota bacterium]NOG59748.1 HDOD domain-containing protein [Pseudomonadota bacterium]